MIKGNSLRLRVLVISLLFVISTSTYVYAGWDTELFSKASKAVQRGEIDFAFMQYRSIVSNYPNSRYHNDALFANAEYYFLKSNFREADYYFKIYLKQEMDPNGKLFALAYRLRIARIYNKAALIEDLEQQIISLRQQAFVFEKFKEYAYQSPFNRQHKAVYSINKIEFYVNDQIFEAVSLKI